MSGEIESGFHTDQANRKGDLKLVIGQNGSIFRNRKKQQLTLPNGLQFTEAQSDGQIVSFISMANCKESINSTIFGLILRGGAP